MTAAIVRLGVRRPEMLGLGALLLAGALLAAVGTQLLTGPLAVLSLAVVFASIVMLVVVATIGTPETRRKIAPYGLLKPGMLWLALFYLAPLFTLLRLSLSTLPSRFAVEAEFDWNFDNYVTAFTDFGPQFQRAFIYAGTATILTIVIGYPLAYVIAFRGGRYRTLMLGLVVIPFFTSFLIRTIAWRSILSDDGIATGFLDAVGLTWFFEAANIMDNGRIINTPAAVDFRSHVQLPALHDPADLRQPGKGRHPPRRRRQGPLLDVDVRVHEGRAPALAAGCVRRHTADVHPRRR